MRIRSWGEHNKSLLDKIIESFRVFYTTKQIKNAKSLLDIGCGYEASTLQSLIKKGVISKGVGIDLSVTKKKIDNIKLTKGDAEKPFPLPKNNFDSVISLALIEHLNNPDNLLKQAYMTLKTGGSLIITTPNAKWKKLLDILTSLGLISKEEISDHKNYYSKNDLIYKFKKAGFNPKKIKVKYYPFPFLADFVILVKATK